MQGVIEAPLKAAGKVAIAEFFVAAWFLMQKARGNVPVQRERAATGFLIALLLWGFIDDDLRALTSLGFHSKSIWLSIAVCINEAVKARGRGVDHCGGRRRHHAPS